MSTPTPSPTNLAYIEGVLSSDPRRRDLPSGDTIHSLEVTTTDESGVRLSVPVLVPAGVRLPVVSAGDGVAITGPVRRRFFRAGGTTASRTEIVATRVVRRADNRARSRIRAQLAESLSGPNP